VLTAISRYGARFVDDHDELVSAHRSRGTLIRGPEIAAFEDAMARRLGRGRGIATSHGRMAAYYIFRSLGLPEGSEVVFPALTFWVVPEMARAAGLRPVFADVDPTSFNLRPDTLERALTPRTAAVVPTHIYGLPCDMDEILAVARRHRLKVVEDCAHALGATYHGQPTGTLGDAALFSFQVLKPLNTCGGGLAFARDPALGQRIVALAAAEPPPSVARVQRRLRLARLERALMKPPVFSLSIFPVLWAASFFAARPDVYLWERVRPLRPFPAGYSERYANVQAALGLRALDRLDEWTRLTRENALRMTAALSGLPGVVPPPAPIDRRHVYYQYCGCVPGRDATVTRCLRRGLDVELHHMDVCPDLELFADAKAEVPGARRTAESLQVPVHAGLGPAGLARVVRRLRAALGAPALEMAEGRLPVEAPR
jgi:dTDP-4-amino-4,6-dideoxygalactose transaminase